KISLGAARLLEHRRGGPEAAQGGHVLFVFDAGDRLAALVDGDDVMAVPGEHGDHMAADLTHAYDDDIHQASPACATLVGVIERRSPASISRPRRLRDDQ